MTKHREYRIWIEDEGHLRVGGVLREYLPHTMESLAAARQVVRAARLLFPMVEIGIESVREGEVVDEVRVL